MLSVLVCLLLSTVSVTLDDSTAGTCILDPSWCKVQHKRFRIIFISLEGSTTDLPLLSSAAMIFVGTEKATAP